MIRMRLLSLEACADFKPLGRVGVVREGPTVVFAGHSLSVVAIIQLEVVTREPQKLTAGATVTSQWGAWSRAISVR